MLQERLKKLKSEHGKVQLGNITVDMVKMSFNGPPSCLIHWQSGQLTVFLKSYWLPLSNLSFYFVVSAFLILFYSERFLEE